MRLESTQLARWLVVLAMASCVLSTGSAWCGEIKVETQLVWATDDSKSPDPGHKPVAPDILEKIRKLPLKWSNYYEVNRQEMRLPASETKRAVLSDKCHIEIKNLGDGNIEIGLFGKGEQVVRRKQALPRREILVLGGNAPNDTAWLIVIKRVD